jgi:hypothetical protein
MIQYSWVFPKLGVTYNEGSLANVVSTSYFYLIAEEDGIRVSWPGSTNLYAPNPASFTPYDQVTQEQVIAWTEQALGEAQVERMKAKLATQLEAEKAPKKGDLNPPWSA